jgi:hypothetical protein
MFQPDSGRRTEATHLPLMMPAPSCDWRRAAQVVLIARPAASLRNHPVVGVMGQKVIIQLIEIRTLVDKGVGFDFGNLLGRDQPEGFRYKEL